MNEKQRYICIHGHFYQPPRENPWLESIELQDGAYPYHDWNERITAECYAPNAASRILDHEQQVTQIVSNYPYLSFNFGPTLLAWMETHAHEVYEAILESDRRSASQFSGHGSALAQAYNHMIMPLANERDKITQVVWGIRDFEYRFGRKPEGMWLPETAVDVATLEILAEHSMRFTILAPHQAHSVRPLISKGKKVWKNVTNAKIDPTMPYIANLPSGKSITLFFYDGPVSRSVAFENTLHNGEEFARRLMKPFSHSAKHTQLVHIATDGETYGHHHRHGDMALAYTLHHIRSNNLAQITNYGEFLEKHPPTHEVRIIENTAWSCSHGLKRWKDDCGCKSGRHPSWHQKWRHPMRDAFDWLRDKVTPLYEARAKELLKDPWAARNDYINVIMDRSKDNIEQFIADNQKRPLTEAEISMLIGLLEIQRNAMLMYTSCGWFFDDVSGTETVQDLRYAGRVIQLANSYFRADFEKDFLNMLGSAESNLPKLKNGAEVFKKYVEPAFVDLQEIGAHFAVTTLFDSNFSETPPELPCESQVYSFSLVLHDIVRFEVGKARLVTGRAEIKSDVTRKKENIAFSALHWGDHNINAGAKALSNPGNYQALLTGTSEAFNKADFTEVVRVIDKHFENSTYTLKSLFHDDQRRILDHILENTFSQVESAYRQLYDHHYPLMRFFEELGNPLPAAFKPIAEFVTNSRLREALSSPDLDTAQVISLVEEANEWRLNLDAEGLGLIYEQTLERIMVDFLTNSNDTDRLTKLLTAVSLCRQVPFSIDMWKIQNLYYGLFNRVYPEFRKKADSGEEETSKWVSLFEALGRELSVRIPKKQ